MSKQSEYRLGVVGSILVMMVGAALAATLGFVELTLTGLRDGDLLTLLATAIFVALVIERAVEVYANNRFDPERADIRLRASILEQHLALKAKALEAEQAHASPDPETVHELRRQRDEIEIMLMREKENIEPKLANLRKRKALFAAMLATSLGLAASIVGVRVLGQFLPAEIGGENGDVQRAAVRFVDVILTSALLAGGADGIHQIIKRFTDIRAGA